MSDTPHQYTYPATAPEFRRAGRLRQCEARHVTTDKLNGVYQAIADNDYDVEATIHMGGRDWLVVYSWTVER